MKRESILGQWLDRLWKNSLSPSDEWKDLFGKGSRKRSKKTNRDNDENDSPLSRILGVIGGAGGLEEFLDREAPRKRTTKSKSSTSKSKSTRKSTTSKKRS